MNKHYGRGTYNMVDSEGEKYILQVEFDEYAEDPREWDNVSKIWCWKRGYKIGDEPYGDLYESLEYLCRKYTNMSEDEILDSIYTPEIMLENLQKSDILFIAPIYCYEHGGITISTNTSYPYSDMWDSSVIGYAFIDKETTFRELGGIPLKDENGNYILEEYKHENSPSTYRIKYIPLTDENWEERAAQCIKDEVKTLDAYLTGNVYEYTLNKKIHIHNESICPHCGEVIDEEDYDDYEAVACISGFYGDCLEDNGMLDCFPNGIKFID